MTANPRARSAYMSELAATGLPLCRSSTVADADDDDAVDRAVDAVVLIVLLGVDPPLLLQAATSWPTTTMVASCTFICRPLE